jgi:hypothetical protein
MRTHLGLLPLIVLVALAVGCSKKEADPDRNVKWPAKPGDGTPLVLEFVKMKGEGKEKRGVLRVFNFQDKDVKRVVMTLRYLDAGGKELKTFPWTVINQPVVEAKKTEQLEAGAFLPEATAKVEALLREVEFDGGGKWESPRKD